MDILNYFYCVNEEDIIIEESIKFTDEIITIYEGEYLNRLINFYVINDENLLKKELLLRSKHNNFFFSSLLGYCNHSFFGMGLIIDKTEGENLSKTTKSDGSKNHHKKIAIIKELINLYDFQNSRNLIFGTLTLNDILYIEKTEKLVITKFPLSLYYVNTSSNKTINYDILSCEEMLYLDPKLLNSEKEFNKYTETWNMGLLIYEIIEGKKLFHINEDLIRNKKKVEILNRIAEYNDNYIVEKINQMKCSQILKSLLKKTIKLTQSQRVCTKIINETFSQKIFNKNNTMISKEKDNNQSLLNSDVKYHFITESNNIEVSLIDFSKDEINLNFNKLFEDNINKVNKSCETIIEFKNNITNVNPININSNYEKDNNETIDPLLHSDNKVEKNTYSEITSQSLNEMEKCLTEPIKPEANGEEGKIIEEIFKNNITLSPVIENKSSITLNQILIPSSILIELETLAKDYFLMKNKEDSDKILKEIENKIFNNIDENSDLTQFFLGMSEVLWELLMCLAFKLLENEEYKNHFIISSTIDFFYDKVFQNNDIKLAVTKYHISKSTKEYKGNYCSSLKIIEEAIYLMQKNNHCKNPMCLQMRFFYGNLLDELGRHNESIENLLELLKDQIIIYSENHLLPARTYNCLGIAEDNRCNYKEAKNYYEKSLTILQIIFKDSDSMDMAKVLNNLAGIYYKWEDFEYSCKFYLKVMKIYKNYYDEFNVSLAIIYNNLGNCFTMLSDYKKALEYLSKAADNFASNLGINNPQTAMTNKNLGDLYFNTGKKDLAKEKYELCLTTFLEVYGEDSDFYITTLNKLKKLKLYSGKIDLN